MDVAIDYKKLGLQVRRARQDKKRTQQKLAELAGLSTNYVGHIERAESVISIETLVKLANALKMPVEYFLQDSLDVLAPDDPEKEIAALVRNMSPKERAFALENIKLCKSFCQSLLDNLLT